MKIGKTDKKLSLTLWSIFGILLLMGIGFATTISNGESIFTGDLNLGENELIAGNLFFGSTNGTFNETCSNRPLTSNEAKTITVDASGGADYTTIQEAVCQVPFILRHKYIISVNAGTYDEDVYLPPIIVSGINSGEGSVVMLGLYGHNKADTFLKSLQITSHIGTWATMVSHFNIYGREPTSDEGVSISVYGSNSVLLTHLNMTNKSVSRSILFYSSNGGAHNINFDNTNGGFYVKGTSQVYLGDWYNDAELTGTISGGSFMTIGKGCIATLENNKVTGYEDLVRCSGGELYYYNNLSKETTTYCSNGAKTDSSFVSGTQSGLVFGMNFDYDSIYDNNLSLDSSKNKLNGYAYDSVEYKNDSINGWVEFDGTGSDRIIVDSSPLMNLTDDITWSAWINFTGLDSPLNRRYFMWVNDEAPAFSINTNGDLNWAFKDIGNWQSLSYIDFATEYKNQWVHVAGTFDKEDRAILYMNGKEIDNLILDGQVLDRIGLEFYIGNDEAFDRTWKGGIDDVRVYNRVLTKEEIKSISNNRLIQIESPKLKSTGGTIYGTLTIGDGTNQENITLTSPDGTEHNCGVTNGGSFVCN